VPEKAAVPARKIIQRQSLLELLGMKLVEEK
jgi:hypothetical protein